jgi:diguanylate cyclase (GGDEF)-like protein
MKSPPPHDRERARLAALEAYEVLDTLPEAAYDDISRLAAQVCGTPIALVSFVDRDRQWFKSRVGLETAETPREVAFCAHAILQPSDVLVVPDAEKDDRFVGNPLVTGDPGIRFYAGAPLVTSEGLPLGTLCVIDRVPRELTRDQAGALRSLARQVMAQMELRCSIRALKHDVARRHAYEAQLVEHQSLLEEQNAILELQSRTDALTGLRNRRAFDEDLDLEYDRSVRYNEPLSLVLLDVDEFKAYNDAFGHPAGDDVLREAARLLKASSRAVDLVARHGGEEFAVLLPRTGPEGALALAERFRRAVEAGPWKIRAITVSVGVATLPFDSPSRSGLVSAADHALYQSKDAGRNRVTQAKPAPRSGGSVP